MSLRRLIFVLAATVCAWPACAAPHGAPVPAQVIYPGDRITESMLVESQEPQQNPMPGAIWDRADLVGKVARRTLLPGRAIPYIAVEEPRAVSTGGQVQLVYQQDGLTIVTTAQALQNGYVGQVVQVRNLDSGLVVSGVIRPDGAVRVNGD